MPQHKIKEQIKDLSPDEVALEEALVELGYYRPLGYIPRPAQVYFGCLGAGSFWTFAYSS